MLVVDHVVERSNAQDLTKVIMDILVNVNGLTKVEVPKKLLCFGAHGVSTFQGVQMELQSKIESVMFHFLLASIVW